MKKPAIKRVGLVGNSEKVSARAVVTEAARLITRAGRRVYCDVATAQLAGFKSGVFPDVCALTEAVDLLLVFGGDGTMLRVASEVAGSRTPVLGINIGGLGFLTAVSSSEMPKALKQVWNGEFTLETRAMIDVTGRAQGRDIQACALNDFVISRGIVSRLITLEVKVDDESLTRYRCDGLIVSSPTGSTAYALSAGGAVVHPQSEVFQLTPICPHTLSNRSVIVGLDSRIEVKVASPRPETILSADGQGICQIANGESVTIMRSRDSVCLMHLAGTSFFETLRRKLHWSGANV
ncbi:MAG TPA: NAD(+)/NADH kinase [Verrucomicrobiae bacterium]|nr:NAD(+)/NADH kinase [Verrucomicrobiae bacterium]